jgi:toxin ParE1/3/4
MRVVITTDAESDLEEIFDHIAADSPAIARRFVNSLREHAIRIGRAPRSYPQRPQFGPGIRVAFHRSYVALFRITATRVEILHIVHGARDLKRLFDG